MRKFGQIAQKLKQAKFRHVKRELARLLRQTGDNCTHHRQAESPGGYLGICSLTHDTCDARVAPRAATCGEFKPKHTKAALKESLTTFFATAPVDEIAVRFPDVAMLVWVLDKDDARGAVYPEATFTAWGVEIFAKSPEEALIVQDGFSELLKKSDSLSDRLAAAQAEIASSGEVRNKLVQKLGSENIEQRVDELLEVDISRAAKLKILVDKCRRKDGQLAEKDALISKLRAEKLALPSAPEPPKGWWSRLTGRSS